MHTVITCDYASSKQLNLAKMIKYKCAQIDNYFFRDKLVSQAFPLNKCVEIE